MLRHLLCSLLLSASLFSQAPLMLGVLQDRPGAHEEDPHVRSIRALFYKSGSDWKPFPSDCTERECLAKVASDFPRETTWTIAFDGRKAGEIHSRIPTSLEWAALAGEQGLLDRDKAPVIGKPGDEFAGWLGIQVLRPLVAISAPNVKDPDVWKVVVLPVTAAAQLRGEFHKKYPRITNCEVEEGREYKDSGITLKKAYASKTGWRLAMLGIKGCDAEDMRGDGLNLEWFTLDPSGAAHYLASNLVLVDAGDYDASGHSQILFMIDDYNRGGYVLFYDSFQKQATFEYHYH